MPFCLRPDRSSTIRSIAFLVLAATCVIGLEACSNVEKAGPQPRAASVRASDPIDAPEIMRGTIGSQARLIGYQDVVVRGYGLVVGLRGTGDRVLPEEVRAHMLREMARYGVGRPNSGLDVEPEQLLDSLDTAVVVVEAVIPAGAPKGTRFDVRVRKMPGTETSSLEGGRLWTAELPPALDGNPMPAVGSRTATPIARASGDVFTNPFALPGAAAAGELTQGTTITADTGRILGGGLTTRDMPLKLLLATPSHRQASLIAQIINSHFPQEPGQRNKTAHGESDESILLTVPPSFHGRTREFISLVEHTSLFFSAIEPTVAQINRIVRNNPGDADHASWRWQALGPAVLPGIKEFYTSAEERPRIASLRAGARLNDGLVVEPLLELARTGSSAMRKSAIDLLGDMEPEPRILFALRELMDDGDVDVRIAAYEALAKANTAFINSLSIDNGKFVIDYVASSRPLIYVTMREVPRIVVFGHPAAVKRPLVLSIWGDRFTAKGDSTDNTIDVRYVDAAGYRSEYTIDADLSQFIPFLGHTTTIERPAPGLGLTYSETIGILWAIHQARYLPGEFRTEQDRILLAIEERDRSTLEYEERPEFERLLEETSEPGAEAPAPLPESSPEGLDSEIFAPVGTERGAREGGEQSSG